MRLRNSYLECLWKSLLDMVGPKPFSAFDSQKFGRCTHAKDQYNLGNLSRLDYPSTPPGAAQFIALRFL